MKLNKIIKVLCWIMTSVGFLMLNIYEKSFYLLLVAAGLGIISFLDYNKFKKDDDLGYFNRKLVFIYAIGSLLSLYLFILDRLKN